MSKIMVVDDANFMRMMLKDILLGAGFNSVIEAKSGGEAIIFTKVERPEIIILDVTMPDMDGIKALKKIKNFDPNIKVIMCSSLGQEDMVEECFNQGADDFIMKPFKPERIIQAISQFLPSND